MSNEIDTPQDNEKALTKRQRELVDYMLSTGATIAEAAETTGMEVSNAYRILRYPHVNNYILNALQDRLAKGAITSVRTLERLLHSRSDKVSLEAADSILDRAGISRKGVGSLPMNVQFNIDIG